MKRSFVFGGARSGKSAYAERCASSSSRQVIYIATAQAGDNEMQARITLHQQQRPSHWITIEEPLALAEKIYRYASPAHLIIVDCLTLWLSNLIFTSTSEPGFFPEVGEIILPEIFERERSALLNMLQEIAHVDAEIMLVSNELGMGITPMGAVSRCFVDEAGRLNQAVAAVCDEVVWVAAGLPIQLKTASC